MIAVIGSVALNFHKQTRTPADMDCVGSYDDVTAFIKQISKTEKIKAQYPTESGTKVILKTEKRIVEFEIAWSGSNSGHLLDIIRSNASGTIQDCGVELIVPSLDILLMIKESHKYRKDSIFFLKTLNDVLLLRKLGGKIPTEHKGWFKERERITYQNTLPKLNQSKKDFFDNSSNIYTLEHDDIHEAVKHLDRPAYENFKPDTSEVMTSKELFFKCSREVKLYAALEEVMVLSLERSIHPFPNVNRKWAFDTAQMKLSTSISSGWFREYCWENYYAIQDMYSEAYVDKFYDALHNGRIKQFGTNKSFKEE